MLCTESDKGLTHSEVNELKEALLDASHKIFVTSCFDIDYSDEEALGDRMLEMAEIVDASNDDFPKQQAVILVKKFLETLDTEDENAR